MNLSELIRSLPVRIHSGDCLREVGGITDDSRQVRAGDLFVARGGGTTDGRRFIQDAVKHGAVAVLTDRVVEAGGAAVLLTDEVGGAGVELARRLHGDPAARLKLIGVTGTNGKTTTTYMVRHLLAAVGIRCGVIGTVEIDTGTKPRPSDLTTPGAIELIGLLGEMVANGCRVCVMEVSSHALDQGRARGLHFAVAAFTNLTGDHLDYHKTMDAYAAAKARLFESLEASSLAVVNADDPASTRMLRDCKARRLSYGESATAECHTIVHEVTARHTDCSFDGPWGNLRVKLPLIGRHNVANMAAALGCVYGLGVDISQLRDAIEQCPQAPGRLERVTIAGSRSLVAAATDPGLRADERGPGSRSDPATSTFDVFVDYAHTDDALSNVLRALRPLTPGKLRVMFGCGGDRDATKRPRMARVACELADEVVITSDNPRTEDPKKIIADIRAGVPKGTNGRVAVVEDRAAAIERVLTDAQAGDVVLLAGKGHEDYQIIGNEKRPFDDRRIAAAIMDRLMSPK